MPNLQELQVRFDATNGRSSRPNWTAITAGICVSAIFTPILIGLQSALHLRDVDILFLIPVVLAATQWGLMSGLAASATSALASAYFLYSPYYSFKVVEPQDVLDLGMFIVAALITSQLTGRSRANATLAARHSDELARLHAFSRRLARANAPAEILSAIQEHTSGLVGARVALLSSEQAGGEVGATDAAVSIPAAIKEAVIRKSRTLGNANSELVDDPETGRKWLVRTLPRRSPAPNALVVDLGSQSSSSAHESKVRVDTLLEDAIGTFDRLDIATALNEAKLREEAARFRDAVIGSVSHGLRTPLAAIMGSASILAESPSVAGDRQLAELNNIVISEAERLNGDIQKMLDAAKLTNDGVQPHLVWTDPTDLVDAAIESERRDLSGHHLEVRVEDDLPLVFVDPALVVQALALVLDNAARYSQPGTTISVSASARAQEVRIDVRDEGVGLSEKERPLVFEKFYRGDRVRSNSRGSGLGLWIANAFINACQGRIGLEPRGDQPGTCVTVYVPAASTERMRQLGGIDD